MKHDDLTWLCSELGLPVFEETADGVVASGAAQGASTDGLVSITSSAATWMGLSPGEPALLDAVARARAGERHAVVVGSLTRGRAWRVLAMPLTRRGDRIRLMLSPSQGEATQGEGLVDLAAAVSHEVSNAVGAIRGWADLALHEGDQRVDMREALTLIRGAARNAEHAARGMLALARGGARDESAVPLDLSAFARELVQLLTLTAREARVTLTASIAPDLSVRASRAQLFTILFNLIKNAIEACQPGGQVSVQAEGDDQGVQLSVRDDGAGLDSTEKQRLFEPYYTTKVNGTGLGLALVRDAVRASGATLEVDSEPGRGTLFRVSVPRLTEDVPEVSRIEPMPTSERSGHALTARILIVEDDRALREMVTTALSLRGAEVVAVRSAEEALALEQSFDIALVDMMLDGCRGDELLSALRQRGTVHAAMLVTGTVQKPRLVPGGEPDDWVRKPFEIAHLVERIRRTLERHRMLHDASSTARY